jgi:hypothetical protein
MNYEISAHQKEYSDGEIYNFHGEWFVFRDQRGMFEPVATGETHNRNNFHGNSGPGTTIPLRAIPVGIKRDGWDLAGFIIAALTLIGVAWYTYYAGNSTRAATTATQIAAQSLRDSETSFLENLRQLDQQTFAQEKAATGQIVAATASLEALEAEDRERRLAEQETMPHLIFQDRYIGPNVVRFHLVNEGGSVATEIHETEGSTIYSHAKSQTENFAGTAQGTEVDPGGPSLAKGQKPIGGMLDFSDWAEARKGPHSYDFLAWRRYTYLNRFGETKSVCIAAAAIGRNIRWVSCLSTPFDQGP